MVEERIEDQNQGAIIFSTGTARLGIYERARYAELLSRFDLTGQVLAHFLLY
jgi:hypothetical protein